MTRRVLLALALGLQLACGDRPPKTSEDESAKAFAELEKNDRDDTSAKAPPAKTDPEEKPKGPVYPAPFTADQIRHATKNGRTYRYRVEIPNKSPKEHVITFRNVDDGGAEINVGSEPSKRMSWSSMQKDAEFPREKVTTRLDKLKTPAGKFECVVYEVTGDDGEVWTYYFAKKLPGAPVFFYVERNGKRLRTTTLIEHISGR